MIDAIGVETASGKLVLTISDHLDWSEENAHLLALQNKINTYLRFIEGGELLATYPQAAGREPLIDLIMQHHSSVQAVEFIQRACAILEKSKVGLRFRVLR